MERAWATDQVTLQTILPRGYAAYACTPAVPDHVRRAVWTILACRPARLGGHVQACPEGPSERRWDNACRHRRCPPWAWVPVERWLTQQQARLRACEPDHVIFTMPHELTARWFANVVMMPPRLCASVHETLVALRGERQYRGAKPGLIATRHPWSPTLILHPPLPCRVAGGGLGEGGQWGAVRHGFLLLMRVVLAVCRGKRRAAGRRGGVQGTLPLPAGPRRQQGENLRHKWGRVQGNVPIRERSPDGPGVLGSLARYVRGGPMAHKRLRACDGQQGVWG
jgi:Transposase zinc-binding domain/Putative transposase